MSKFHKYKSEITTGLIFCLGFFYPLFDSSFMNLFFDILINLKKLNIIYFTAAYLIITALLLVILFKLNKIKPYLLFDFNKKVISFFKILSFSYFFGFLAMLSNICLEIFFLK